MTKVSRIASAKIRKISGGKDPSKTIEDFLVRRGFDPAVCLQQKSTQLAQWLVPLSEEEDLEITLEGLHRPMETTLYMGVNVVAVPLRDAQKVLHAALTVADTLIGAKLSLVNYDIVLSVTSYADSLNTEEVDYLFELITRQKTAVYEAISEESLL